MTSKCFVGIIDISFADILIMRAYSTECMFTFSLPFFAGRVGHPLAQTEKQMVYIYIITYLTNLRN